MEHLPPIGLWVRGFTEDGRAYQVRRRRCPRGWSWAVFGAKVHTMPAAAVVRWEPLEATQ